MADPADDPFTVLDGAAASAASEAERRESRVLLQALSERRGQIGALAQIPADDRRLSEQILAQARSRSAEIRAAQQGSGAPPGAPLVSTPISWWLWAGWIIAILAIVLATLYWV
jgi:hypothetical protein